MDATKASWSFTLIRSRDGGKDVSRTLPIDKGVWFPVVEVYGGNSGLPEMELIDL